MAQRALYRRPSGEFEMAPDSAQVIEKGDLLFNNTDDPAPAEDFAYVSSNLAGTQANFAAKFLGVAEEGSASGETRKIKIRNTGQYEFDCAAATFEVGDLVGVDDNAGGTALVNQQVIGLGENDHGAIGRVVRRYSSNTTRVLVELLRPSFGAPIPINLGQHTIGAADEFVTDLAMDFPFKATLLETIVATVTGAGAEVLSLDKNATTLDDTLTIAATSPVGTIDRVVLDDASGDDLFLVGDTISLSGDGGTASGAVSVTLWVRPFNMQVA